MESQREYVDFRHTGNFPQCGKLADKQQRWIDANDSCCSATFHSESVVAVTAADVQNIATFERLYGILDSIPLHVGMPFCVQTDTPNLERTFAPWCQSLQERPDSAGFFRRCITSTDDNYILIRWRGLTLRRRQKVNNLLPSPDITMGGVRRSLQKNRCQRVAPGGQADLVKIAEKRLQIQHLSDGDDRNKIEMPEPYT